MDGWIDPHDVAYFGIEEAKRRAGIAPAQEEKEMGFECRCKKCDCGFMSDRNNSRLCGTCKTKFTAELRKRWDRAFFAALTGSCDNPVHVWPDGSWDHYDPVGTAEGIANEIIRRHADLMAERDKLIAEVVG